MSRKKHEWLTGGGQMAQLIAELDWSKTPLGPLESWPQSLRTTVSLCLASNFPINIIWGDAHSQIYNDGYRNVCGAVHPRAMGEDYRVTWASAWEAIGCPFERALSGETTYLENQRMFLERNGYQEETFFTFSLSPIRDESGKVVGLFHPVVETTATILAERRTGVLRDVADRPGRATDLDAACRLLLEVLASHERDLPFALLYVTSADGRTATLAGTTGIADASAIAPLTIPIPDELDGRGPDVLERSGPFVAGPYPEPVSHAFVFPMRAAGVERPLAFLTLGASPRLPLDEAYRAFLEMFAGAAAAALGNARAYEAERSRAEALAELDRAKTTFFSNVSHEFRTPLTLLLGPIEDLLGAVHGDLSSPVRSELELVRRNALRLLKLVNALLDFSRVEAGRSAAAFVEVDLVALTRDLVSAFRSAIERAGVELVVELDPAVGMVAVDRDMWEKIVLNLLSNAFKFTKEGSITVTLRRASDRIELAVGDTGIGISKNELGRVFQRFHRVHGASGRTYEGSGIGLALVQDLAKLHGGSADVESTVGEGTTFYIRIPVAQENVRRSTVPEPPTQNASTFVEEATRWLPGEPSAVRDPANPDPRPTILLADDNADMRDYVRRLLEQRYRVEAVADGVEALAAARASVPDLVLTDLMMPNMDGAELVQSLRADESTRTVPIVLLSARAGDEATASGLELGADDYLTKPFAATELTARVASLLKMAVMRRRAAEQDVVERELTRRVDAQDEFLAIASHELRTPLTSLRIQVQLAERAFEKSNVVPPSASYAKMLGVMSRQVERLHELVNDLLDVGRIRSGQLHLAKATVDIVALVTETLERFAAQLTQAKCSVTTSMPARLEGSWDAARLEQVVTNLLENATKYASGSPVHVSVTAEGASSVVVGIRDHGPGIPPESRRGIFDRFDRAKASKNAAGLGLGLFIARQLVEAHGGTISAEPTSDRGANLVVRLPR